MPLPLITIDPSAPVFNPGPYGTQNPLFAIIHTISQYPQLRTEVGHLPILPAMNYATLLTIIAQALDDSEDPNARTEADV